MDDTYEGKHGGERGGRRTRAFGKERDANVGLYERIINVAAGGALVAYGVRRRTFGGLLAAVGGGLLAYRGATGYCPMYERAGIDTTGEGAEQGLVVHRAITIERPIDEVYRYWRDFENLPRFMGFVDSVEKRGEGLTHWVASFGRFHTEWDARIVDDQPNRRIAWRSVEGARLPNEGHVEFVEAPGGRGTEVHLRLRFIPPGRQVAQILAPMFRLTTRQKVAADLSRLKQILETGEVATAATRREGDEPRYLGGEGGSRAGGSFGGTTSRSGETGGTGGGTTRVPGEPGAYGGGLERAPEGDEKGEERGR